MTMIPLTFETTNIHGRLRFLNAVGSRNPEQKHQLCDGYGKEEVEHDYDASQ
jgi:hypothetical protein